MLAATETKTNTVADGVRPVIPPPPPPSRLSFDMQESTHKMRKSASYVLLGIIGCSSPFMRLAEQFAALRAWCTQCLAWSVKTRRAPSRHCSDARVYCLKTTVVHGMSTSPGNLAFPSVGIAPACFFFRVRARVRDSPCIFCTSLRYLFFCPTIIEVTSLPCLIGPVLCRRSGKG